MEGTSTQTWSMAEIGRSSNTRARVVIAGVVAALVRFFLPFLNNEPKYWNDSKLNWIDLWIVLRWICLQFMSHFSAALSVAGEYTVNGARCLRGGCRLNPDVNYWWGHHQLSSENFGSKHLCQPLVRIDQSLKTQIENCHNVHFFHVNTTISVQIQTISASGI